MFQKYGDFEFTPKIIIYFIIILIKHPKYYKAFLFIYFNVLLFEEHLEYTSPLILYILLFSWHLMYDKIPTHLKNPENSRK